MADINEFTYTYKRPKPNSVEAWEVACPSGHRLILKVRRSRIAPIGKHLAYQARCTCRWANDTWHRDHKMARKDFLIDHIQEVVRQGRLV